MSLSILLNRELTTRCRNLTEAISWYSPQRHPHDAVTGNYKAVFRIGGATFTKRIRIETVKPNRLKINLNFPGEILGGSDPVIKRNS